MTEVFRTSLAVRSGLVVCALLMLILAGSLVVFLVAEPPTSAALWLLWGALLGVVLALGWLVIAETRAAMALRIALDDTQLRLHLPSRRGLARLPRIDESIPHARITAIETRREAFRQIGAVAIQQAWSLQLDDGRRLVLGSDRPLRQPLFAPAAAALAQRTGLRIHDLGMVQGHAGVLATAGARVPDWTAEPLSHAGQGEHERRHALTQRILTLVTIIATLLRGLLGR